MNDENGNAVAASTATASDVAGDPVGSIRALAAENAASIRRLRSTHIPQHVGMAAACRALAVELPRTIAAQIDADLTNGVLAQRWDAVRAATEPGTDGRTAITALAQLLREQGRAVMRHLLRREKEWAADAYRLEGQADALEAQLQQLRRLVAGPAGEAADTAPETAPQAGLDAVATAEPVEGVR